MELYYMYLGIDFVFQFIVEKYRNKLIKSNQIKHFIITVQKICQNNTQTDGLPSL